MPWNGRAPSAGPDTDPRDFAFLFNTRSPSHADTLPAELLDLPLAQAVARLERALVVRAMALSSGNRAKAARQLGISRQSLYTRMTNLGMSEAS